MERTTSSVTCEALLRYPAHLFDPEDLLTFVQGSRFSEAWDKYNLNDQDLQALEISIMAEPKGPPVISGTGGLRKIRFRRQCGGKRGGFRICYVYFEDVQVVFLPIVYGKNEQDDLTDSVKAAYRQLISEIKASITKGSFKIG